MLILIFCQPRYTSFHLIALCIKHFSHLLFLNIQWNCFPYDFVSNKQLHIIFMQFKDYSFSRIVSFVQTCSKHRNNQDLFLLSQALVSIFPTFYTDVLFFFFNGLFQIDWDIEGLISYFPKCYHAYVTKSKVNQLLYSSSKYCTAFITTFY